ncbi:DUF2262 domain-containing protein [Zavarzinella formosa]|uniref:DUF2262 domain-containing protein n=1 Tax=Zavarzinella formosa TaxID=360055 RepID=UPI00036859E3|nr:DUF2262 domain-containing protein [Zavarzinella formosa]
MPEHEPFADPNVGTVRWDSDRGDWLFIVTFPSGRTAEGSVRPEDNSLHLSSPEMEESRACIHWVQSNEPALRQYVADKMYRLYLDSWHDPEHGPALTQEEFRDKLSLVGVQVLEDHRAFLVFSDAECFGGHAIVFSVGADGILDEEPDLWG